MSTNRQTGAKHMARKHLGSRAASGSEYGLILGLVALVAIGVVATTGDRISEIFGGSAGKIDQAIASGAAVGGGQDTTPPPAEPAEDEEYPEFTMPIVRSVAEYVTGEYSDLTLDLDELTIPGDMVLAFISHRGALELPSEWTLLSHETVIDNEFGQQLSVYKTRHEEGDPMTLSLHHADTGNTTWLGATTLTVHGPADMNVRSTSSVHTVIPTSGEGIFPGTQVSAPVDDTLVLAAFTNVFRRTSYYGVPMEETQVSVLGTDWFMRSPVVFPTNRFALAAAWGDKAGDVIPAAQFVSDDYIRGNTIVTTLVIY